MAFVNVYFSLGSNLGDRKRNILSALDLLDEELGVHYSALSRLIETRPVGFTGGKFLNGAVLYRIFRPEGDACSCGLDLLDKVKKVERQLGRTDPPQYDASGNRIYRSRTIDIDILFYGDERIDHPRLTVPHKGIAGRPFVMIPLLEIARPSLRKAFPEYFDTQTT